jgi:restriction endonuclease Mrr
MVTKAKNEDVQRLSRKEKHLSRRDDEALEAVLDEMQRNRALKSEIVQTARSQDYENFVQVVRTVLNRLGRTVDNFANFVNNAFEWFRNL